MKKYKLKLQEQHQSPPFPRILGEVNAWQEWTVVDKQKPNPQTLYTFDFWVR